MRRFPVNQIRSEHREPSEGLGQAVFKRVMQRGNESWRDVATRVSKGNAGQHPTGSEDVIKMFKFISKGALLLSGRQLQHSDETQKFQDGTKYSNCATAPSSSIMFYLLMKGSGVGRCYDDDLMLVDWKKLPDIYISLSRDHKDFAKMRHIEVASDIRVLDFEESKPQMEGARLITIGDSVEGMTRAIEQLEEAILQNSTQPIILDGSFIRPEGEPIKGMQDRPAPGPVPLLLAFDAIRREVAKAKEENWDLWKLTLIIDHHLAASVVHGGARRSARIAFKHWQEKGIDEFIDIKLDNDLWTANNSVVVDELFEAEKDIKGTEANRILKRIAFAQFNHLNGEPGILNAHKLKADKTGLSRYETEEFVGSQKYRPGLALRRLYNTLAKVTNGKSYQFITNPCGEITLYILCGYCVIGDCAPYFCDTLDEVYELFAVCARALIRNNLADSIFKAEVSRTNRIGVGITGLFEFALKFFDASFHELKDETTQQGRKFWAFIRSLNAHVEEAAALYSKQLGLVVPHTMFTMKPAGTTSKLFLLTEGAHLPSHRFLIRNIEHLTSDPKLDDYRAKGYRVKELQRKRGTSIVGFPMVPLITEVAGADNLHRIVTAREASIEDQLAYLRLLEENWIDGGKTPGTTFGNQVSYTLKFDVAHQTLVSYTNLLSKGISKVKAFAVLPYIEDKTAYEYMPEEEVTREEFEAYTKHLSERLEESVDYERLSCESGACPI